MKKLAYRGPLHCARLRPVAAYVVEEGVYAKLYSPERRGVATHLHILRGAIARREFLKGSMSIPDTVTTVSFVSPAERDAAHTGYEIPSAKELRAAIETAERLQRKAQRELECLKLEDWPALVGTDTPLEATTAYLDGTWYEANS